MNPEKIDAMAREICNTFNYPMPPSITLNSKMKSCLGRCNCQTKEIELNEYVVLNNPPEIIRALLAHEICHTRHCNHSKSFKIAVKIMGSSMHVTDLYPNINLPYRYTYECPTCHGKFYHDKRADLSCGQCSSVYKRKFKLKLIRKNYE